MRILEKSQFIKPLLCCTLLCSLLGRAQASGSAASTFDVTSSTSKGTDSSGSTSDSSKSDDEPSKPRKLSVPIRARDEAALYLVSDMTMPQSALLRSTIAAFRRILQDEGQCKKRCTDAEVIYLLLARTEASRAP